MKSDTSQDAGVGISSSCEPDANDHDCGYYECDYDANAPIAVNPFGERPATSSG